MYTQNMIVSCKFTSSHTFKTTCIYWASIICRMLGTTRANVAQYVCILTLQNLLYWYEEGQVHRGKSQLVEDGRRLVTVHHSAQANVLASLWKCSIAPYWKEHWMTKGSYISSQRWAPQSAQPWYFRKWERRGRAEWMCVSLIRSGMASWPREEGHLVVVPFLTLASQTHRSF